MPKKPAAVDRADAAKSARKSAARGAAPTKPKAASKRASKVATRVFTPLADEAPTAALSEVPQAVYGRLSRAAAPLTAYDLIDSVQKQLKRRLHPPTIYRALSQLVERGLVHRLESGSSYIACASPGEPHHSILFVCTQCGTAEEAVDNRVHGLLQEDAAARGFIAESEVIEVRGRCSNCSLPN